MLQVQTLRTLAPANQKLSIVKQLEPPSVLSLLTEAAAQLLPTHARPDCPHAPERSTDRLKTVLARWIFLPDNKQQENAWNTGILSGFSLLVLLAALSLSSQREFCCRVPATLTKDSALSPRAELLYLVLAAHANIRTGRAYLRLRGLKEHLDCSSSAILIRAGGFSASLSSCGGYLSWVKQSI